MKDKIFIVADAWGVLKMTKREPVLNRGEVAVRMTVTIPDGCFKNPILEATADVAEDRVIEAAADVQIDEAPTQSESPTQ